MTSSMNIPKPEWRLLIHCNKRRDYRGEKKKKKKKTKNKTLLQMKRVKSVDGKNINEMLWFMLFVFSLWLP